MLRPEVLEHLRADPRVNEPERRKALALARSTPENPFLLNDTSWRVVRTPGGSAPAYERALRLGESACKIQPNQGEYVNTLGVSVVNIVDVNSAIPERLRCGLPINSPRRSLSLDQGSRGVYSVECPNPEYLTMYHE